jgi:hypothetical protein
MKKFVSMMVWLGLVWQIQGFCDFMPIAGFDSPQIAGVCLSARDNRSAVLTPRAFYLADDGEHFKKAFVLKDEIAVDVAADTAGNSFYFASTRRVFDERAGFKPIFIAKDNETITGIALCEGKIYLSTNNGFYIAAQKELRWHKFRDLSDQAVYFIFSAGAKIFLGAESGLYCFYQDKLEKLFAVHQAEDAAANLPQAASLSKFDLQTLILATSRGIFISRDTGKNWKKIFASGLNGIVVNQLSEGSDKNIVYAATDNGFLKIDTVTFEVSLELSGAKINRCVFSHDGTFYLASRRGLLKQTPLKSEVLGTHDEKQNEPEVFEVQQAAMRYNQIHPEKIQAWRNQLKARGFMPKLSIDYNKTMNFDSKTYRYITGPRDWGLTLAWDLGDIVWNNYEDDVDTRARLDTQMRFDLLDEVARVYFERRRVEHELATPSLSKEEAFQRNLRLDELTAALNGYTGGWFLRRVKELEGRKK